MSTTTRPRAARATRSRSAPRPAAAAATMPAGGDERMARIKAIHQAAARKATRMTKDESAHRSTAMQRAQREKARAFEEIGRVITGKG